MTTTSRLMTGSRTTLSFLHRFDQEVVDLRLYAILSDSIPSTHTTTRRTDLNKLFAFLSIFRFFFSFNSTQVIVANLPFFFHCLYSITMSDRSGSKIAQATFELENSVVTVQNADDVFRFDNGAHRSLQTAKPWQKEWGKECIVWSMSRSS